MKKVVGMDLFDSLRLGGCLYILHTFLLELIISILKKKGKWSAATKILDISACIETEQDALGNALVIQEK